MVLRRLTAVAASTVIGVASLLTAAAPAQAAAVPYCYVQAQTPYKHTRVTGQKQAFGRGIITRCYNATGMQIPTSSLNAVVTANLQRWNNASPGAWVGFAANHTQETRASHLAYDWLCTNYGFGGTVVGAGNYYDSYFRVHATVKVVWNGVTYTGNDYSSNALLSCR